MGRCNISQISGVDASKEISPMKTKSKLTRRNFLLAVGAGGAATAAAIAIQAVKPVATRPATGSDKRRGKGYQETAHVRSYYNTAKV